jgi:hypothetical protein
LVNAYYGRLYGARTKRRELSVGHDPAGFALGSPGSLQKETLFRINRPTKMAVSDRPNA